MEDTANRSRTAWNPGRFLPRLMLFFFLLDLLLRFVPLDPLTFRAWEAMLRRYPNAEGPFTPNKHYHRDNSYGGVAAIGNLPALRHYHASDFTTDSFGFHNPPALAQPNPVGIVLGDSFAVGSELPEDQSLSAQLTHFCGAYFYNAGAAQPLRLRSVEAVAKRLGLVHGLVVYEFLESHALTNPPAATPDGGLGWGQSLFLRVLGTSAADRWRIPLNQFHDSPLQGLSAKLEKQIQNNVLLPNSFADFVIQEKLRNGESIVFLPAEFKFPRDPRRAAEQWSAYFSWYAGELRKDGLDLVVLLVPNRSTIYAPLLAKPRDVSASRATLIELSDSLRRKGVLTVPFLYRYEGDARVLLDQNKYLYLLDDSHWNGDGTSIAASEVFSRLRESATYPPTLSDTAISAPKEQSSGSGPPH